MTRNRQSAKAAGTRFETAIATYLAVLMVLILWPAVLAAGLYAAVKTGRLEYIRED